MKKVMTILFVILGLALIGVSTYMIINPGKEEEKKEDKKDKPNDDYNLKIIKQLSIEDNYAISPYSIEIALQMLKAGAAGNTYDEIHNLIGDRNIKVINGGDKISVANAVFIKEEYKSQIEDNFTKKLKNDYSAEVLYDAFTTPKVINDWVKENTKGMIDKILDDISADFVLGLANAVAIDVQWETKFECERTRSGEFTKADGTKIDVEMMHDTYTTDKYKYFETENATGVILPYKKEGNEQLEFVGILPKEDVKTYVSNLTNDELNNIDKTAKSSSDDVRLYLSLPRFKYTYDNKEFGKDLKKLGIKDAFDSGKANFTKMIKDGGIFVGTAIHKTYIELSENGTKAAAVTYFGMDKNAVEEPKYEIKRVEFNKPFAYIIRDKETKDIIFFGETYSPNEWKGSTCTE